MRNSFAINFGKELSLFGRFIVLQNCGKAEWLEGVSETDVKFAHKFNPEMKKSMLLCSNHFL